MYYIIGYLILFAAIYFIAYKWEWRQNRTGVKDALHLVLTLVVLVIVYLATNVFQNIMLDQHKYSHRFNNNRKEIGLQEIPASWQPDTDLFNNWTDYLTSLKSTYRLKFVPPTAAKAPTAHTAKTIEVQAETIQFETDWFRNGERKIDITYDFRDKSTVCFYYYRGKSEELTLSAAKDTLEHWGISL